MFDSLAVQVLCPSVSGGEGFFVSAQPNGLAKRKGVAARRGLKEARSKSASRTAEHGRQAVVR